MRIWEFLVHYKLAEAGLKGLGSAMMKDPRVLVQYANRATGPIAAKLQKPLQALERRGQAAYKAAVFTLLHDPEVRKFLEGEKKDES